MSITFHNVAVEKYNEAKTLLARLMPKYQVQSKLNYLAVGGINGIFIEAEKDHPVLETNELRLGIETSAQLGVIVKFKDSLGEISLSPSKSGEKISIKTENALEETNIVYDLKDDQYIEEVLTPIVAHRIRVIDKLNNS